MNGRGLKVLLLLLLLPFSLAQAQTNSDKPDYFITAAIEPNTAYPGQQVLYHYNLYTAVSFRNSPIYVPPVFDHLWQTGSTFNAFSSATVNGRAYNVTTISTVLYTIDSGLVEIPAATTRFEQDRILETDPVSLRVVALPPDAPSDFSGAVGQFEMHSEVSRERLALGDFMTLAVTISGTGNLEMAGAPQLALPAGWRVYFRTREFSQSMRSEQLVGEKIFEWTVIPAAAGDYALSDSTWTFFDPALGDYRSLNFGLGTVHVEESANPEIAGVDNNSVAAIRPVGAASLSVILLRDVRIMVVLWLAPPAAAAIWWIARRAQQVRNNPYNAAARRLVKATALQPSDYYREVEITVRDLLALVNANDSAELLAKPSFDDSAESEDSSPLAVLLECSRRAEAARFAEPVPPDTRDLHSRTLSALRLYKRAQRRS